MSKSPEATEISSDALKSGLCDIKSMQRRDVIDAEFQVVEGPGRIRWGAVLFHFLFTALMAWWAMGDADPLNDALAVFTVAVQWPLARLFSSLMAPRLQQEQVEPLAERLRRGTRTKL